MVRAWHHGEREGMEAEHGSRADATAHKSGGVLDCEGVRSMLACSGTIRWRDVAAAELPAVAGEDLRTKPDPLSDPMQEFLQEIAKTLLGSPTTGPDTELELEGEGVGEDSQARAAVPRLKQLGGRGRSRCFIPRFQQRQPRPQFYPAKHPNGRGVHAPFRGVTKSRAASY
jgi:hypothetical protein